MGGFGQYVLAAQGGGGLEPDRAGGARWVGAAAPPLLGETRICGGPRDGYQTRHATRAEALDGHRKAVELARSAAPGAAVTPGAGSASAEGAGCGSTGRASAA